MAHLGMFFEFGDEAGIAGGFVLWGGATVYPGSDPTKDGPSFVFTPGVELRTGFIPFLTGPNQISPQVRLGVAWGTHRPDESPSAQEIPDLKIQAILGYRWAFEFGLDNLDRRRKDENAIRLGVDVTSPGFLRLIDPIPLPNALMGFVDINRNGTLDRFGFTVGLGF